MSKSRLIELNQELNKILSEIEDICAEDGLRSIIIPVDDTFSESFGTIVGSFRLKLDNFRTKINRIADKFPVKRRKRK